MRRRRTQGEAARRIILRNEILTQALNLNLISIFPLFCLLLFLLSLPTLHVIIFLKVSFLQITVIYLPKKFIQFSLIRNLMTLFSIVVALRTLIQLTLLFTTKFQLRQALLRNVNFQMAILCSKRILQLYPSKTCRTMQKSSRSTLSIPTNHSSLLANLPIQDILFLGTTKSSSSAILPTSI